MQKITPCLWFDTEAEQAAELYTSIFEDSRITSVARNGEAGPGEPGSALVVEFELTGQRFQALNGGPQFPFTEAVSMSVSCESQEEVDHFWERLGEGGHEDRCGWLKDRFGLSWQVVPTVLPELLGDPDPRRSQAAMQAMLDMGKLDVAELRRAADAAA